MGILVKIKDGKPVTQDYTDQDVLLAIANAAGPKPDGKKSQIAYAVDQLRHVKLETMSDVAAVQQVVRILGDVSRDIAEIGNYLQR